MTAQREWVTFADPTDDMRRWQVDVTFLTSHWTCVFGCGCQGVLTEPTPEMVQGCCSYGAHFSDKRDRKRVEKFAEKLTDADWQFAAAGRARGIATNKGHGRTRLVDDACIFLNRPDFPGGPGCALHRYALRTGQRPMDLKPEVCWQLPLRRVDDENDDGSITTRLTEFGREGWGDGGAEFAWWCTDAPEAFTAADPVYKTLSAELIGIMGATLYAQVAAYLDARCASSAPPIRHPAEVPVQLVTKKAKSGR